MRSRTLPLEPSGVQPRGAVADPAPGCDAVLRPGEIRLVRAVRAAARRLALEAALEHAERFAALLARVEATECARAGAARSWLVGRPEEVRAVLWLLGGDCAAGHITADQATRAVVGYLAELHAEAGRHLGWDPVLECCADGDSPTVPRAEVHDAVTRPVP